MLTLDGVGEFISAVLTARLELISIPVEKRHEIYETQYG